MQKRTTHGSNLAVSQAKNKNEMFLFCRRGWSMGRPLCQGMTHESTLEMETYVTASFSDHFFLQLMPIKCSPMALNSYYSFSNIDWKYKAIQKEGKLKDNQEKKYSKKISAPRQRSIQFKLNHLLKVHSTLHIPFEGIPKGFFNLE